MLRLIDFKSNVRWTPDMVGDQVEAWVERHVSIKRERILARRLFSFGFYLHVQAMPDGHPLKAQLEPFAKPLPDAAMAEMAQAAAVFAEAEAMKDQALLDAVLLSDVLDYEAAQAELDALPLPPDPDENGNPVEDPHAGRRAELLQALSAASEATVALVLERAAWREAQNPPPAPEPETTEEQPAEVQP